MVDNENGTKEYILLAKHEGFKGEGEDRKPHTYQKGDKISLSPDQALTLANKIKDPEVSDIIAAEDLSKAQAEIDRLSTELANKDALIAKYQVKLDELGESLDEEEPAA